MPTPAQVVRPPNDPDVTIPAAVRAAAAKADQLHAEFIKPADEKPEVTPEGKEEPKKPEAKVETKVEQKPPVVETKPEAKVETKPQPQTDQQPDQNWEHAYKSMKGRFDALQAQTNSQLSDAATKIASLEATLATLKTPADGKPPTGFQPQVTPDEEREYGSEFLEVVAKKAQDAMMPYVRQLEAKVAELSGNVASVGTHVAGSDRQKMMDFIDTSMPNWRDINKNPKFLEWLALPDPYSGAIRQEMLDKAYGRNNGPQVLAFFNGFLKDEAVVDPQTAKPDAGVPPVKPQAAPKVSLTDLAAPGRAKDTAADAPVEKPTISTAQITQFYADVAAGKYRGKDAEKANLEAQIFEAQRDGRIK